MSYAPFIDVQDLMTRGRAVGTAVSEEKAKG